MITGRFGFGVAVGPDGVGAGPLGRGVAVAAVVELPDEVPLVAAGFTTAGAAGVGSVPGGTTAPATSQPVTPALSRTWRQVVPLTTRSGPSTSIGAPSASVFRTLPPGSERMLAPWPLVLPIWPRPEPPLVARGIGVAAAAAGPGVAPVDGVRLVPGGAVTICGAL